jgi:hypothetical protein
MQVFFRTNESQLPPSFIVIAHLQIEFPQMRILIDLACIMLAKGWTEELKSCNMLGGINVEISGR